MYAWTELRNGGEAERLLVAGGRGERFVVKNRNVIKEGEEVSQDDIGVDDETWEHWQEIGSVRSYPKPEGVDDYTSASQALVANLSSGGELDLEKLMEMGITNPAEGGYSGEPETVEVEAEEEVTAPSGA